MFYIDTLYVYAEQKVFDAYHQTCSDFWKWYVESGRFTYVGVASGYTWYQEHDTKNRVGIMDFHKSLRANQPPFQIQYSSTYLIDRTLNIHMKSEIDLDYYELDTYSDITVKRVDFTHIKKMSDDYLISPLYISPYQKDVLFRGGGKIETLYLGKRTSGQIYRHYNKSLELEEKKDYKKMNILSDIFGDLDNLYTFEIELHRKWLSTKLKDLNIINIDEMCKLAVKCFSLVTHVPDTDYNKFQMKNRHYDKLQGNFTTPLDGLEVLVVDIGTFNKKEKRTSLPSFEYMAKKIDKMINDYNEKLGDNYSFVDVVDKLIYTLEIETENTHIMKVPRNAKNLDIKRHAVEKPKYLSWVENSLA